MYLTYLMVWLAIILILNIMFRVLPAKMKETNDRQTKNSLFTILMVFSIPLILMSFIGPIIILAGDENMPADYKIYFVIIASVVIIVSFFIKSKKTIGKSNDPEKN